MRKLVCSFFLIQLFTACVSAPNAKTTQEIMCNNGKALIKPSVLFRTSLKIPRDVPLNRVTELSDSLNKLRDYISQQYFIQTALYGKLVGGGFNAASIVPDEQNESIFYIFVGKNPKTEREYQEITQQMPDSHGFARTRYISTGQLYLFFKNYYIPQELDSDRTDAIRSIIAQSITITKNANEAWAETLVTLDLTRICKYARNRNELFTH